MKLNFSNPFAAVVAATLVCASNSQAQTRTWDGGGGNNDNWDTVNNWDNNALPENTADVVFGTAFDSGTSVNLIANRIVNSLTVNTATVFTIIGGDNLTLTSGQLTRNDVTGVEGDHSITAEIILGANGVFNINGSEALTINGAIGDGANTFTFTKSGSGVLILGGGAETYKGDTIVSGGILRLGANNQITDGAGFGNLVVNSGGTFDLENFSDTINGLSGDGIVDKTAGTANQTLTVGGNDANGDFSGIIQNTDADDLLGLTKTGAGIQILSGNNTYRGVTTVNNGVLNIRHANALGSTVGSTTVATGAAVQIQGNIITAAEALTIDGTGISATGALRNVSGDNSWAGTITIANVTGVHRINSDSGTLTIGAGGITETGNANNKDLTFGGSANILVSGNIIADNGDMRVFKDGSGILTLSGANAYDGTTTITNGTLLANNASGSATGIGAVSVEPGGRLGGTGTITPGNANGINVTGVLAPGGSLNPGNLTFNLGSTTGTIAMNNDPAADFEFDLGLSGVDINNFGTSDVITLAGAATGDFAFNNNSIDFLGTGAIGFYKLFDTSTNDTTVWTGLTVDGNGLITAGLTATNLNGALTGKLIMGGNPLGGTSGDIYLHVVPEPSVALLGGIGVMFLFRRRRA